MKRLLVALCLLGSLLVGEAYATTNTIMFSGGQDIDFTCTGTCTVSTTAGRFRSAWTTSGLSMAGTTADPPTNYELTSTFTAQQKIWVHFQYWNNGQTGTSSNAQLVTIYGSDGNPAIAIRGTGVAGQLRIDTRNTSGTFATLLTCNSGVAPTVNLDQYDVFVNYNTSGEVNIYLNGSSICDFTGNVTTNSRTAVNQVRFAGAQSASNLIFSEVIICADGCSGTAANSLALGRLSMIPNGDGTNVQWSTASGSCATLGPTTLNDGNFIAAASNNLVHECTVTNTLPAGTFNVDAVQMSMRALRGATGPQHIEFVTRPTSVDRLSADQTIATAFGNVTNYLQPTNPDTGSGWATTDLTAGTLNFGVKSTP